MSMTTATLDMLKFVKTLKKSRMPEEQAEAISDVVRQSHETANLTTRQNMIALEERVNNKFEFLRKDIKAEFADVRKEMQLMQYRIIGIQSSVIAAMLAIVESLKHFL